MVSIRLENIDLTLNKTKILNNIDLEIFDKELFALIGPSGSGKSSLLRVIAGLEKPSNGRIFFGNVEVTKFTPQKRKIGMVFQDYALWPHMSVKQNLEIVLKSNSTLSQAERDKRIFEVLELLRLEKKIDERPNRLSGGEMQRVALGRALVSNPSILLMDEPLSNLDAKIREGLSLEIVKMVKQLGITTIFVTHDQEEANRIGDRIGLIFSGRIEQIGYPEDLYYKPSSNNTAKFIGENLVVSGQLGDIRDGYAQVNIGESMRIEGKIMGQMSKGDAVEVVIRTGSMAIPSTKDNRSFLKGKFIAKRFSKGESLSAVELPDGTILTIKDDQEKRETGDEVIISVDPGKTMVFALVK
ncbi:MAG: ABC transporter ATP-binding protein [Thermoplasmata archaeon]